MKQIQNDNKNSEIINRLTIIDNKLTLLTKDEVELLLEYKTLDRAKQNEIMSFIEKLNK